MYEQNQSPYANNVAIVKKYFASPRILILGILYIITVFVNLIPVLSGANTINSLISSMSSVVPSDVLSALSSASNISAFLTAVGQTIFSLLMALAFILIFAKSRSSSPTSDPMGGLTIMFVIAVINLVATIVITVVVDIFYFISLFKIISEASRYSSSSSSSAVAAIIGLGIGVAIVEVIAIAYAASLKNFYRSARRSLRSSYLENTGAAAYGVFCILQAIAYAILMLVAIISIESLSRSYTYYYYSSRSGASTDVVLTLVAPMLLNIVVLIFNAVIALGYNSYINSQRYLSGSAAQGSYNTSYGGYSNNNGYPDSGSYGYNPSGNGGSAYPSDGYGDGYGSGTGSQFGSSVYCPSCGTPATLSDKFCQSCGTRLK